MKKYLTQPIHDAHYKQMCQSVCYFIHQVSIAEAPTLDDDLFELFFNKEDSDKIFVKADKDRELDLQSLMAKVNTNDIIEIWKISRYNHPKVYQYVIIFSTGEHLCTCFMLITHGIVCRHFFKVFVESSKARFHLTLIPCRWYKDEYISSSKGCFNELIIGNCNSNHDDTLKFIWKYTVNDLSEKYSKQISQKRLKYGILMGEAKKAIQFAIQDGDDELIQFIKEFNERKKAQWIQTESFKQQRALANRKAANDNQVICRTNGILIESNQILDPLKHQSKGRPLTKRLKPSTESENSKSKNKSEQVSDKGRKCGLCEENGYYRNTCSLKNK